MDEYKVEFFVVSDGEYINLDEKEMEQWKKDMEVRALSEYYKQKIKISSKKI